ARYALPLLPAETKLKNFSEAAAHAAGNKRNESRPWIKCASSLAALPSPRQLRPPRGPELPAGATPRRNTVPEPSSRIGQRAARAPAQGIAAAQVVCWMAKKPYATTSDRARYWQ